MYSVMHILGIAGHFLSEVDYVSLIAALPPTQSFDGFYRQHVGTYSWTREGGGGFWEVSSGLCLIVRAVCHTGRETQVKQIRR